MAGERADDAGEQTNDADESADPAFPADGNVLEPNCARCPALVESRTRISWGCGPTGGESGDGGDGAFDADVLVVGEAPAAGDPEADRWRGGNLTGRAYTSRHSGRRIRRMMADCGLDGRVYYTNAVKCFPADGDGGNRAPAPDELDRCRGHLETELRQVDPDTVVPTGKHATETVLALAGRTLDGFLDAVLEPVDAPELGVRIVPLLHPSYQNVWRARLGYTAAEYREAVRAALGGR